MVLCRADLECLKLNAWCKDLPQSITQEGYADISTQLILTGYLRKSKCGFSYRLTNKGYDALEKACILYERDKQYLGKGKTLTRRLELSKIVLFLYSLGADVFIENPTQIKRELCFMPSFSIRRAKASNILGGTRMTGFLYAHQNVFIPYYISDGNGGLYPGVEQMIFSTESLSNKKAPIVVYTGASELSELVHAVYHAENKSFRTKAITFKKAIDEFTCPVCLIPLSQDGARQLRILCQPDYKTKLAKILLNKDGYVQSEFTWCDAINQKYAEPFIVGFDFNLKGFDKALSMAKGKKVHIALLDFQFETAKEYLKNKNAALYAVKTKQVEAALSLPEKLYIPDMTPYQTRKGEFISVTNFKACGKT